NFFNQELYGPPTNLPWGIPIDCAHRIAAYPCTQYPEATTFFHPLFLYESISGTLGAMFLIYLGYHYRRSLRPGDLLLVFFIWYGIVRFGLETLRADNWTFFGVPTAMLVSLLFIVPSAAILLWRHRRDHPVDDPPTYPDVAYWGAMGRPVEAIAAATAASTSTGTGTDAGTDADHEDEDGGADATDTHADRDDEEPEPSSRPDPAPA
ncbi:MAG TPA: prolipoprotein diacylglyceryl transferase family protein, partial [Actinomycetota bacterium]|nr:prolipoprotein diacylglyceryl transferase family protein [Actinomycetota bacterium]